MADPQLDHEQDDEEELEHRRQTQSRRAQPLLGRYLWSETTEKETSDLRVATPVADSDSHQKGQHRSRRAYTRDDMGIRRLPELGMDSKYETPPRPCRSRFRSSLSPNDFVKNDSRPIWGTPWRPARDTTRNDSLPSPAPGSESKLMRQLETRPISQDDLVAEVRGIYAGLVMVETKCIEVDKDHSSEGRLTPEEWQQLIAFHRKLLLEDDDPFNISSTKESQNCDLGELLSELSLRSRSFCRLNSRLLPLLQAAKRTPSCVRFVEFMTLVGTLSDILRRYSSLLDFKDTILTVLWGVCWMFIVSPGNLEPEKFKAPVPTFSPAPAAYNFLENSGPAYYELGLQSVLMPEPSTTGYDQHPTIDSLLFNDHGASIDPIYLVQAAPQDPDFLSLGVLPRNSARIAETPAKEDLTGAVPAAVTPDPMLQIYGDTNCQEPFNQVANVASVCQGVQNTGGQKSSSSFACPKCQQTFATSFTLNRHQTEAHKDAASSPEDSFPCPNRGCKRHLRGCKHNPNVSTSTAESDGMEEQSLSHPISTPALPSELQPAEPLSEGSSGESIRKRSRSENDDDWSEKLLLREMKKKLKRMAEEVKEKEDAYLQAREVLESMQKTIQVMEDSLRKS
ncbi:hypothetical protein FMUND_8402 [Fusarium mundagurra]|uniref:C2H2-type domain-containing protein n=1 Tax=Fusarium mundagurra TaxID=1567541 RepID=A0A8H5YJJ3_9HYPO|nr:hypothetical protein FMUND_8402 [Fusarium mundagurra]